MKNLFLLCSLFCAVNVAAQTADGDSIATENLNEIVIEAPKVIRKADMDVYHPSKSAVENAKNGMQLLNNLMIPTLTVNDALSTVQAAGQSCRYASTDVCRQSIRCVRFSPRPSSASSGWTIPVCATAAPTMYSIS